MPDQIALIEAPVYETTGDPSPPVLEQIAAFDLMGTTLRACLNQSGDTLFLHIGRRRFAVSLIDLAATAALATEAHLKQQIVERVKSQRPAVTDPDEALGAHHFGAPGRRH